MRMPAAILTGPGLGKINLILVPPSAGVTVERAREACAIARGTWDAAKVGCMIPDPEPPPSWCGPFGGLIFEACELPDADELAKYGSYTAYKIAQKDQAACQITYANGQMQQAQQGCVTTGTEAAKQVMKVGDQQSADLIDDLGCEYNAAREHPWLSSVVGPGMACSLTDPFAGYGWMVYVGLGVAALVVFKVIAGGRR